MTKSAKVVLATSRRKISELWAYARIAFSAENCKVERIWH